MAINLEEKKYIKIDELSREYALTDEQLLEYLFINNINILDNNEIDLQDDKVRNALELLRINSNRGHENKSILQSLRIEGLFGKYNYSFDFKKDISIWISENGVGKTTILNIIVAIITGDARFLYDIKFNKIVVNIDGRDYVLDKKNKKNELDLKGSYKDLIYSLSDFEQYLPRSMSLKIRNEILHTKNITTDTLDEIISQLPNDDIMSERIERYIYKIKRQQYENLNENLFKIKKAVMKEEIVFYPTYRRVEVGIERVFLNTPIETENIKLKSKYIRFGMGDVKGRIDSLLEKLRKDANTFYINMNADIISELLTDKIDSYINKPFTIDTHKVEVVLKRIGEDRINNIEKLKSFLKKNYKEMSSINIGFLVYYLQKLVCIYEAQEAINKKLSKFAIVCSKYLSGKKIEYDETMLTVKVLDKDGSKIDFNDLSSGEKQIISIFSKVYLDVTSQCIFIIDEPEIFLSIEWQKDFLKDIYDSGKIALLIATTHSPFIFSNDYVNYVKELELFKV